MAESVLYGLTKTILSHLSSLALDELQLLWGHKEQLHKLEDTITTIRNVLQDAESRQPGDAAVRGWLARLKDALYEADDLFDSISAKILHDKASSKTKVGKEVHKFLSKPFDLAFVVRTSHKVKAIRQRLDDIARDISQFNFISIRTTQDRTDLIERERSHSYISSTEVIGREQEMSDLVKRLLSRSCMQQRGVSVVVIIGIGGLGKTALAQVVYNDPRIQQGFDLCMWACINYFKHLDKVLVELVGSTTRSTNPRDLVLNQLKSCFRQKIKDKRFLLVLDDVWDEDPQSWCSLRTLLNDVKDGSMVLATTRSTKVAQSLCVVEPYYDLKVISDHNAWLLFKKMAFDEGKEPLSDDLEQLGRQIVKKCSNVPLSIITIANSLRYKEKKKWFPLVNDELSKVVPNEYGRIMQVLKISYNELLYPVKCCFAYCSLFPKGYGFEKEKLTRLWIAQGFVEHCVVSQSFEDTAEDYFSCLVERCFFGDMRMSKIKGVKIYTWRMNNLVLDLAKEVAKLESVLVDQVSHSSWDKTLRHVSIDCDPGSLVGHSFDRSKSLRSFLCLSKTSIDQEALSKLVLSFKAIRALDLSQLTIKEIPSSIGELIHLRFLDLSKNDMERLPSSICNLHHLQSLILQGCDHLVELPGNLEKLLSLRQLVIGDCNELFHLPAGLAALTSLVILKIESCAKCIELPPLSHLPSLKELYIKNMSSMVAIEDNKLYKPDLFFPSLETLWLWDMSNMTSWWLQGPTELPVFARVTKLNIRNCQRLITASMPLFPLVEHLKLESVQNDMIWHGIKSNVVKRLRICRIRGLKRMAEAQTRNLSNLQKLSVYRCEQLQTVSCKVLAHLTSLQKLKITACKKLKWVDLDDHKPEFPWRNLPRIKYLEIPVQNLSIHKGFRHMTRLEVLKLYTPDRSLPLLQEVKHLTSLQQLTLTLCKEVHLSWKVLLGLNRLQILTFSKVEKVIDVSSAIVQTRIGSLQELKIYEGSEKWINDIPWKLLESLQYLHLSGIHDMEGLLEGLQCLSALQKLKIMVCKRVVSLPCWIRNLSSLRYLEIRESSRELKKRCEESRGEDWPYVEHIQERFNS